MDKPKSAWDGLGVIAVVRQSNDKDGTGSTEAQLDHLRKDLAAQGMNLVDAEILEGVPASAPARINEVLEKLFKRKREKNDFQVIAWMVEDRASRGGLDHGIWMEHECLRRGLKVYFPGDDGKPAPFKRQARGFKYEAARQSSELNAQRTSGGQGLAQKLGFFRTGGPTPFGCDRVYYGADDKPKFTIHNLPNGLQEQREWGTGRLIGTYGSLGKKSRNRYKKQRNEYSLLIPGDRSQQKVVRVIFFLHYKRGWGGHRIAVYLNQLWIPAPKCGQWCQRQVEVIYENEAYTGLTYNNRWYKGRFARRDREMGFVALNRDETEFVLRKSFNATLRPPKDWDPVDQPHLYDFLPNDLRDLATAKQYKLWRDRADPARTHQVNPRPTSTYLLSDRLRAVQDGTKLCGTLSGPRNRTVAYYRHPKSKKTVKDCLYNRLIPAEPLHAEVMRELTELLQDLPDLEERLTKLVNEQRAAALRDQPDVNALEAEREELKGQIAIIVRSLSGAALADAQRELERLGARRNVVEAALAAAQGKRQHDRRPVAQVVQDALQVIEVERHRLLTLPGGQPLIDVVNGFVADAKVDLETKDVTLEIELPAWALQPKPKSKRRRRAGRKADSEAAEALCLPTSQRSSTGYQTQLGEATHTLKPAAMGVLRVLLAEVVCRYIKGQPVCYECRRRTSKSA